MKQSSKFCLFLLIGFLSCHWSSKPRPVTIRLIDLYKDSSVEGRPAQLPAPEKTEWRFDAPTPSPELEKFPATRGWDSIDVTGLKIESGHLTGHAKTDFPIIHIERTSGLDSDIFHGFEIRLRVSAGKELSYSYESDQNIDLKKSLERAKDFPWFQKTKLIPGEKIQTYAISDLHPDESSRMRHLLIRPTDAAGATFEIESVRIIFRKEYLAGIPSGLGWEGLSQIYHESIVSRSPEKITFPVTLPDHPWLDLALGTVENEPVTFRVNIHDGSRDDTVLERTVTTPHQWEPLQLDLSKYANRKIQFVFSLSAEKPAAIGLWGSPAVRNAGALPKTTAAIRPAQGVILIWADTLRRDHLDAYGYKRPTAPQVRKLAAEGAIFQDCITQGTWTKVSTPSLMTSLYPTSHRVHDFTDRIPASATTLAEVFHDAGYATLSMSSILFTGKFTNLQQGFEEVHEDSSLPDPNSSKTARIYVDRLLPWIEAHRNFPFFVFLHVSDPHDPYRPYPPYDTMWADGSKNAKHELQTKAARKAISDPLLKAFGMPTQDEMKKAGINPEEYVKQDRDWYDGSIRAMDAEIGKLVQRLRTLRLADKTLLVFIGDHGEEFLEHGRTFHGQSVYGELSNVPLIFWAPGRVKPGTIVKQTIETIDVMPTLLQMNGLPVPAAAQGKSFLSLLRVKQVGSQQVEAADSGWNRAAFIEKNVTSEAVGAPPPRDTQSFAVVLNGWKLIHNIKRPAAKPEYELFDERNDPLNQKDVAASHPEIVSRLSRELDAWHKRATAARLKPDSEANKALSQEEMERLRSLGYIN